MDYMYEVTEEQLCIVKVKLRDGAVFLFNMTIFEMYMLDEVLEMRHSGESKDNRPLCFIHYESNGSYAEKTYIHYDDIMTISFPILVDVDGE